MHDVKESEFVLLKEKNSDIWALNIAGKLRFKSSFLG